MVWFVEDGVPRGAPLPRSYLVPYGRWRHARGREHCRGEPGSALSRGKHQIWRGGRRAAPSSTSHGSAGPQCARTKGVNREVFEGKADLWPRLFSSCEGRQGAANGKGSSGFLRDAQGFGWLDTDSRAGFTSSRPPPPWTSIFQFPLFLYDVWP